ncbi:hypothetical protein C8J57DRAFT_1229095 [Mycena rebaudengoi]|nr:hypothetical protein C8J57DRAFT_1229095 [Mycena rebaudengoi]
MPIPVRTNISYGLVDYVFVRRAIFSSLYSPYTRFAPLARALADLGEGDATAMFKMLEKPLFECGCDPSEYRFEALVVEAGISPFVANTSFPLPLVGNTADPVTPLNDAKKVSKGFAGSIVLTQDSARPLQFALKSISGNTSLTEPCPIPTLCPVIGTSFDVNDSRMTAEAQTVLALSPIDHNLLDALQDLARTFNIDNIRFPFGLR